MASTPLHTFMEFLVSVTQHIIILATFPHDHHQNKGQRDRGINPITMTIINPRKVNGKVRDRTYNLLFSSPVCYQLSYAGSTVTARIV